MTAHHASPFRPVSRPPRFEIQMPSSYNQTARWVPRIGDYFPNFSAETTHGWIDFHSWAGGDWVMLFSHPQVRGPVSYTELVSIARAKDEFSRRGVRVLGLCNDNAADHREWNGEIEDVFGVKIDFPVIADVTHKLSEAFGMIHPKEGHDIAIRKTFIIDGELKIRMVFEYSIFVGRSTIETLRVIDALQVKDRHYLCTPADWVPGDECLIPPSLSNTEAERAHPGSVDYLAPNLRVVRKLRSA